MVTQQMKKRLLAFFLAAVTVLAVVLTGCSSSTDNKEIIDTVETATRKPKTIVLTLMTGDETKEEDIKAVQDAINEITTQRFKTQIILRYFKESEYEAKIDEIVADIAEEETLKEELESKADAEAKESKRYAAIDKLIAADKDEGGRSKWYKEEQQEETETQEYYETELNILGSSVEKYPAVTSTQMDIFLICGTKNLIKYVNDETYATNGDSFLVALDDMLAAGASELKHYINPNVLYGGKVGNTTYAIPTNRQIASEYTYLVLNKELMAKYNINGEKVGTLTDAETIKFLSAVKAGEGDAASPILNSLIGLYEEDDPNAYVPAISLADAPGIVGLFPGETTMFGTYLSNAATSGMKSAPKNILNQWQYTDFYAYMKQFERNGYFCEKPSAETTFGLAVVKGDESYPKSLDASKYEVKVLEKPVATSETTGEYMLGISKYASDADRCMEIITFLNTNAEFRNLLQYGIEGTNYRIDEVTGKLERLNRNYMMNIYTTGNTFIAYPEEDMPLDAWDKAMATNSSTLISPYLGFEFETEENATLIANVKKLSEDLFKRLDEFDPEKDRIAKIGSYTEAITQAESALVTLRAENVTLTAAYEPFRKVIDPIQARYDAIKVRLDAANAAHKPFLDEINIYQGEVDKQNSIIQTNTTEVTNFQAKIDELKAAETPDQKQIDYFTGRIEAAQKNIAAAEASLETSQASLDAAKAAGAPTQKVVDDITAEITPVSESLNAEKAKASEAKTALDENLAQIAANEESIVANQKLVESMQYETSEEYDKIVIKLYEDFFKTLNAEVRKNESYTDFMNVDNENGVTYLYNTWYEEMYGA